ncbi:MAG: hypothetical protein E6686_08390 [Lachnospiraceae bacterium]|nr:hypothetical protein [Lachnospiraceae bacterium]
MPLLSAEKREIWKDSTKYEELNKLLHDGWKVVMCNRIGNDLEYILEKEDENDKCRKD